MGAGSGSFSASASATGYLYQLSWSLADLLTKARVRPDQSVTIEGADDVVWSTADGDARELIQTKVHAPGATSLGLTNQGVDLWKTLRVWLSQDSALQPDGPQLTLVSTSVAPVGSAAQYLQPHSSGVRDVATADDLLEAAAKASTSQETRLAREAYLALKASERQVMLSRVQVLDGAFQAGDVFAIVRSELDWALPNGGPGAEDSFLDQVWGWWYRACVQLLAGERSSISVQEVRAFVREARDAYGPSRLPTTVRLEDVDSADLLPFADAQFVTQLKWVRYSEDSLRLAITDYYRAVTQETYWADHQLLGLGEVDRFEANLRFEWERVFAQMVEDLSDLAIDPDALEIEKELRGRELARSLLASTDVLIRDHYQEPFFARGKRHELANHRDVTRAIGWHADFLERLEALLAVPVGKP